MSQPNYYDGGDPSGCGCGCIIMLIAIIIVVAGVARAQDIDAPSKPGDCALYFIARDKHSNTYQLTCSDPQPDAITIEHAGTDSAKVYPRMTNH